MYGASVLSQALWQIFLHLETRSLTRELPVVSVGSGPILEVGILSLREVNSQVQDEAAGEQQSFLPRSLDPKAHAQGCEAGGSHSCRARNSGLNPTFLILRITAPGQAGRGVQLPVLVVGDDNGKKY